MGLVRFMFENLKSNLNSQCKSKPFEIVFQFSTIQTLIILTFNLQLFEFELQSNYSMNDCLIPF